MSGRCDRRIFAEAGNIRFGLAARAAVVAMLLAAAPAAGDTVRIQAETPLGRASEVALAELKSALAARGEHLIANDSDEAESAATIQIGTTAAPGGLAEIIRSAGVPLPSGAESAAVAWLNDDFRKLVIAGHDDRGLSYALREVARGVALVPRGKPWSDGIIAEASQPFLRVRNVSLHLFNADCEREWFFREEFWRDYFARLSLARFNRCTLTFSDQTNYLCPAYAYLVEMPEYPQIKVAATTAADRAANLAMLRRISELADDYAIDFDLGIWMQAPVPRYSGAVGVTGLPEGLALAEYCALGLRRLYEQCPSLDGIQLRMNEEAGVTAEQQTDFYRPLFQALAAVGRPLRVELRYKGLQPATIAAAVEAKLDVTVSTKFWSEHLGQPYHPMVVDSHWADDRYSFGTMLRKPRPYRVTYQLWNVGSNRLTMWGDPGYASQFARSCKLGDGEGFEVFAPLTNKGYGNAPGAWPVIVNPEYRVGRWEQERYWFFYLSFGRMGYDPAGTSPEVWRREFRHRFGADAAPHVEQACIAASSILPTITTALLPGASEWSWWPEMDTGGDLQEYSHIQTSDPGRYSAIRAWKRTPNWRWEDWDVRPGYVEQVRDQRRDDRVDYVDLCTDLEQAADAVSENLNKASQAQPADGPEWRMTQVDLKLLRYLALYHRHKMAAAGSLAIYEEMGNKTMLLFAALHLANAVEEWRNIITTTEDVYGPNLVFGITSDSPRSKLGHHHSGHWRDRLPGLESDANRIRELAVPHVGRTGSEDWSRFEHHKHVTSEVEQQISHEAQKVLPTDRVTPLRLQIPSALQPKVVQLRWRPLDQTQPWRSLNLAPSATSGSRDHRRWDVTLPAVTPDFDLQYYFVLVFEGGDEHWGGVDGQPYFVLPVVNAAGSK